MDFFFLRQDLFGDATGIEIEGHTETSAQFNWVDGIKFDQPFPRDTFLLDEAYGGNYPDFFDTTVPVMSPKLIQALRACGVSNIDTYPVVLWNKRTGSERDDYQAVNVIGRVDAIDLSQSPHEVRRGKPRFKGKIVIDPARASGLLAFRMPFGPSFIVIAEPVAARLQQGSFDSLLLQPTRAFDGD
jgi:hypothetical protein